MEARSLRIHLVLEVIRNVKNLNACKYYATKQFIVILLVSATGEPAGYIQCQLEPLVASEKVHSWVVLLTKYKWGSLYEGVRLAVIQNVGSWLGKAYWKRINHI